MVLLPAKEGETAESIGGYLAPLRQALIDNNSGHVIVVVCKSDYHALKRGIENLPPLPDSCPSSYTRKIYGGRWFRCCSSCPRTCSSRRAGLVWSSSSSATREGPAVGLGPGCGQLR